MTGNAGDYGFAREVIASGRRILAVIDRRAPDGIRFAVHTASATRALPAPMQEIIVAELVGIVGQLTARGRQALGEAERAVDAAGSPTTLNQLAHSLEVTIGARSRELAPRVRVDALEATDEGAWSGRAARLYRDATEGQGEAVSRIAGSTEKLADVVRELAGHLDGFVWSLTASIVGLVAAAMGLLTALFGGIEALAAAIVVASASIVALAGAGLALVATLVSNSSVLSGLAHDAALSIEEWPTSRFGER